MNKPKVYIAGPYTIGDTAVNVKRAIDYGNHLFDIGFHPYIPHLSHFWHLMHNRHYEDWMELDFAYLIMCDCVFYLNGESSGVERELKLAKKHNIPIFDSIIEIDNWRKENEQARRDNASAPVRGETPSS